MSDTLLVMGGGRMGAALIGGLVAAGRDPASVTVVEARPERRAELAGELPGVAVLDAPVASAGAVIAVKPADAEPAVRAVAAAGAGRLLSIMAGVTLANLEAWSGPAVAVLRAMPNTPALVRAGVSAVAAGSAAGEEDLRWAEAVLGAVGVVVRVEEADLDAVTGLSGSGPAYVFLMVEGLIEAGIRAGLSDADARTLVVQTLAGSARLLVESGVAPRELRAQVTSPGGTTEAGVAVLEQHRLRSALVEAVAAATERSRELGHPG